MLHWRTWCPPICWTQAPTSGGAEPPQGKPPGKCSSRVQFVDADLPPANIRPGPGKAFTDLGSCRSPNHDLTNTSRNGRRSDAAPNTDTPPDVARSQIRLGKASELILDSGDATETAHCPSPGARYLRGTQYLVALCRRATAVFMGHHGDEITRGHFWGPSSLLGDEGGDHSARSPRCHQRGSPSIGRGVVHSNGGVRRTGSTFPNHCTVHQRRAGLAGSRMPTLQDASKLATKRHSAPC